MYSVTRDVIMGPKVYISGDPAHSRSFRVCLWPERVVIGGADMEKNYKKSRYAHLPYGDVSYGPGTATLHAHDGPLVAYAPAGGQDGSSFFPDIREKEHRTRMNPPKKPGPTKFPPLPVKSGAGNMGPPVKCHMLPNAGVTLAYMALGSRKSFLVQGEAVVPKPQVSSLDFSIQGVAVLRKPRFNLFGDEELKIPPAPPPSPNLQVSPSPQPWEADIFSSLELSIQGEAIPLKPRSNPVGDRVMKMTLSPPPSPVFQPSPPPQPCPHRTKQRAATASRPRVQIGRMQAFRPMPYNWSKWCT